MAVAATSAALLTGHAATLDVDSASIDAYASDQAAPTTTSSPTTAGSAPLLTAVSDFGGTTDGKFELGDWIEFQVDKPLDPTTVPSSVSVELHDPPGDGQTGPDTLAIELVLPSTQLASNYLSGNQRAATFAGTATLLDAGKRIRVTLGTCTGACRDPQDLLTSPGGNVTFTLETSIKGTNGLAVTGSVAKTGFKVF
jgi:hypothetical protein